MLFERILVCECGHAFADHGLAGCAFRDDRSCLCEANQRQVVDLLVKSERAAIATKWRSPVKRL